MGNKEWDMGLGARAVSTPVIGIKGLIYVSTSTWGDDPAGLHCLDQDGRLVWSKVFDTEKIYGPVIENDGNIIIAYEERDVGNFIARYSPYGELLLVKDLEGSPFLDPVLDDEGMIYLVIKKTHTEWRGGYYGGYRTIENYNLTKFTPGLIDMWEFLLSTYEGTPTLPTITSDGSIAVNGKEFYFLSSEGEVIWSDHNITTDHPVLYFKDHLYFAIHGVVCYDLQGNQKWTQSPTHGSMGSTIALTSDNGLVFFDDDYYIYKLDLDGMMIWEKDIQSNGYTNPLCSSDGYIFGCSNSEVIKFDSKGNRLLTTDYIDIPEGDWKEIGKIALSSDGSIYFSAQSGIARFKGIDISGPITFAWISLIFITIGATIGAFVLYQKRSIKVIRKKIPSLTRGPPYPYPSAVTPLQCPNCARSFVPRSRERIICPFCGVAGEMVPPD